MHTYEYVSMHISSAMTNERLFHLLENIHPMPGALKNALNQELQRYQYPKNHFLVQVHSTSQQLYFLEKGFAVSYYFQDGKKIVTSFWKPGEIILSPKSFCEHLPSDEAIQLTMESELLALSFQSVNKLFENFPIANVLARAIVARCHALSEERRIDLHYLSAWERYMKLLKTYPGIGLHAAQEMIASYLNITPQSLSRLRHERG
jgi:CRP-like cAMP-binding protein